MRETRVSIWTGMAGQYTLRTAGTQLTTNLRLLSGKATPNNCQPSIISRKMVRLNFKCKF